MSMSIALSSLARYGNNVSTHIKNWRPQIVVFNKLTSEGKIKYPQLLSKYRPWLVEVHSNESFQTLPIL